MSNLCPDSIQGHLVISHLGLSGDEKFLIASGDGGEVSIYSLSLNTYSTSVKHTKWVYGLAVHPTQPLVATASYDKTIRLWDLNSGVNTLTLFGFDKELYTLAFSPDGKKLIVGQVNGVVNTISF